MADDECQMADDEGQNSEPMTEGCSGPVVGQDSNLVIEDSRNDKIGILSHEAQGEGAGQCLPDGVARAQKAQNKANLESKQNLESHELKSENHGADEKKQSQFTQGETTGKPSSCEGRPARQSGRRRVGSEAQGSELLRLAGIPRLPGSDDVDSPGDGPMNSLTYRATLAGLTKGSPD